MQCNTNANLYAAVFGPNGSKHWCRCPQDSHHAILNQSSNTLNHLPAQLWVNPECLCLSESDTAPLWKCSFSDRLLGARQLGIGGGDHLDVTQESAETLWSPLEPFFELWNPFFGIFLEFKHFNFLNSQFLSE